MRSTERRVSVDKSVKFDGPASKDEELPTTRSNANFGEGSSTSEGRQSTGDEHSENLPALERIDSMTGPQEQHIKLVPVNVQASGDGNTVDETPVAQRWDVFAFCRRMKGIQRPIRETFASWPLFRLFYTHLMQPSVRLVFYVLGYLRHYLAAMALWLVTIPLFWVMGMSPFGSDDSILVDVLCFFGLGIDVEIVDLRRWWTVTYPTNHPEAVYLLLHRPDYALAYFMRSLQAFLSFLPGFIWFLSRMAAHYIHRASEWIRARRIWVRSQLQEILARERGRRARVRELIDEMRNLSLKGEERRTRVLEISVEHELLRAEKEGNRSRVRQLALAGFLSLTAQWRRILDLPSEDEDAVPAVNGTAGAVTQPAPQAGSSDSAEDESAEDSDESVEVTTEKDGEPLPKVRSRSPSPPPPPPSGGRISYALNYHQITESEIAVRNTPLQGDCLDHPEFNSTGLPVEPDPDTGLSPILPPYSPTEEQPSSTGTNAERLDEGPISQGIGSSPDLTVAKAGVGPAAAQTGNLQSSLLASAPPEAQRSISLEDEEDLYSGDLGIILPCVRAMNAPVAQGQSATQAVDEGNVMTDLHQPAAPSGSTGYEPVAHSQSLTPSPSLEEIASIFDADFKTERMKPRHYKVSTSMASALSGESVIPLRELLPKSEARKLALVPTSSSSGVAIPRFGTLEEHGEGQSESIREPHLGVLPSPDGSPRLGGEPGTGDDVELDPLARSAVSPWPEPQDAQPENAEKRSVRGNKSSESSNKSKEPKEDEQAEGRRPHRPLSPDPAPGHGRARGNSDSSVENVCCAPFNCCPLKLSKKRLPCNPPTPDREDWWITRVFDAMKESLDEFRQMLNPSPTLNTAAEEDAPYESPESHFRRWGRNPNHVENVTSPPNIKLSVPGSSISHLHLDGSPAILRGKEDFDIEVPPIIVPKYKYAKPTKLTPSACNISPLMLERSKQKESDTTPTASPRRRKKKVNPSSSREQATLGPQEEIDHTWSASEAEDDAVVSAQQTVAGPFSTGKGKQKASASSPSGDRGRAAGRAEGSYIRDSLADILGRDAFVLDTTAKVDGNAAADDDTEPQPAAEIEPARNSVSEQSGEVAAKHKQDFELDDDAEQSQEAEVKADVEPTEAADPANGDAAFNTPRAGSAPTAQQSSPGHDPGAAGGRPQGSMARDSLTKVLDLKTFAAAVPEEPDPAQLVEGPLPSLFRRMVLPGFATCEHYPRPVAEEAVPLLQGENDSLSVSDSEAMAALEQVFLRHGLDDRSVNIRCGVTNTALSTSRRSQKTPTPPPPSYAQVATEDSPTTVEEIPATAQRKRADSGSVSTSSSLRSRMRFNLDSASKSWQPLKVKSIASIGFSVDQPVKGKMSLVEAKSSTKLAKSVNSGRGAESGAGLDDPFVEAENVLPCRQLRGSTSTNFGSTSGQSQASKALRSVAARASISPLVRESQIPVSLASSSGNANNAAAPQSTSTPKLAFKHKRSGAVDLSDTRTTRDLRSLWNLE